MSEKQGLNIELKIEPAQIQQQVVDAIIATSFGEKIKDAVDYALKKLGNSYYYEDELTKWVTQEMRDLVRKELESTYKPAIEAAIKKAMEPVIVQKAIEKVVTNTIKEFKLNDY